MKEPSELVATLMCTWHRTQENSSKKLDRSVAESPRKGVRSRTNMGVMNETYISWSRPIHVCGDVLCAFRISSRAALLDGDLIWFGHGPVAWRVESKTVLIMRSCLNCLGDPKKLPLEVKPVSLCSTFVFTFFFLLFFFFF